jgi:hypothetical protein
MEMRPCVWLALVILVGGAVGPGICVADTVSSVDGGIVLKRDSGAEVVLTKGAADIAPVLSRDGKVVAFLRTLIPAPELDDDGAYELRTIDIESGRESTLYGPPNVGSLIKTWNISALEPIDFSADGKLVYFSRREAQTSFQLVQVTRSTKQVRVAFRGIAGFKVIKVGPYEGRLLVAHRELHSSGVGFIYVWCLLDENHKIVRKWPSNSSPEVIIHELQG